MQAQTIRKVIWSLIPLLLHQEFRTLKAAMVSRVMLLLEAFHEHDSLAKTWLICSASPETSLDKVQNHILTLSTQLSQLTAQQTLPMVTKSAAQKPTLRILLGACHDLLGTTSIKVQLLTIITILTKIPPLPTSSYSQILKAQVLFKPATSGNRVSIPLQLFKKASIHLIFNRTKTRVRALTEISRDWGLERSYQRLVFSQRFKCTTTESRRTFTKASQKLINKLSRTSITLVNIALTSKDICKWLN